MTAEIRSTSKVKLRTQIIPSRGWELGKQLAKFSGVGILNTLLDAALYLGLTRWLGISPAAGKILSYSAGILNSYLLNGRFTFQSRVRSWRRAGLYLLGCLAALGVNAGVMVLGLERFQLPELLAFGAATGFSFLVNFWFSKRVVFR